MYNLSYIEIPFSFRYYSGKEPNRENKYIIASSEANAFEMWLADMVNRVVAEDAEYNAWQHPVAFVNHPSLDPFVHNLEPCT